MVDSGPFLQASILAIRLIFFFMLRSFSKSSSHFRDTQVFVLSIQRVDVCVVLRLLLLLMFKFERQRGAL